MSNSIKISALAAMSPITAFISRSALRHNVMSLKKLTASGVKFCGVVKANAYGHDCREVTKTIADLCDAFAVQHFVEAEKIYPVAQGKPILVFCPVYEGLLPEVIYMAQARGYCCTITSVSGLHYAQRIAGDHPDLPLKIHLNIDTGMGRVGLLPDTDLREDLQKCPHLHLAGVFTHYSRADQEDLSYSRRQLELFHEFLKRNGLDTMTGLTRHTCNTAGSFSLPEGHLDMIRPGLGLFGYSNTSEEAEKARGVTLKPVLKIQAPLVQVKILRAGASCGYGNTFTAKEDMPIGIVAMGYADGLLRYLSNNYNARINDTFLPIVGRVSMDQIVLDLRKCPDLTEGTMITILDNQKSSPCSVYNMSVLAGTIEDEILTSLDKARIRREFVD